MISSNVSSITSHQIWMDNNAQNVANVNTDRYVPKDTRMEESGEQSVKAQTRKADDMRSEKSQTNLAKEITDQISIESTTTANIKAIQTQNEMLGSLLDIKA